MTTKPKNMLQGSSTHLRTEHDYMGAMLDSVTLQDWREVCKGALELAKTGDAQSRAWLGQYLVGQASQKAPTPVTVILGQLQGENKVVDTLTRVLTPSKFDFPDENALQKAQIKERLRIELQEKIKPET